MRIQHLTLCVAALFCCVAMVTTAAAADSAEPKVERTAELAAPPLVLPAAYQDTTAAPEEVSVMAAPTESDIPAESGTQVHVETEVIAPPAPVVAEPSYVAYKPMCKELPVSNHVMHIGARRFARCKDMMPVHVQLTNPAECNDCCYSVCVKVPACCSGEPEVCERTGLLGRGVVEYRWSCGWTAKVVFRIRGDTVVHYTAG